MSNAHQNTFFVDDDEVTMFLYQRLAKKLDIDASYCIHGQELMDALENCTHANIILDINMPVMNGLTVIRELHKSGRLSDYRIMVMMGSSDVQEIRDELKKYNVERFVPKPLKVEVFKEFLELDTA